MLNIPQCVRTFSDILVFFLVLSDVDFYQRISLNSEFSGIYVLSTEHCFYDYLTWSKPDSIFAVLVSIELRSKNIEFLILFFVGERLQNWPFLRTVSLFTAQSERELALEKKKDHSHDHVHAVQVPGEQLQPCQLQDCGGGWDSTLRGWHVSLNFYMGWI